MNTIELSKILENHSKWLRDEVGGVRANLREANLRGANLEEANLYGANLEEANLYEANLRRANLRGANLDGANLERANLREADLEGANLRGADLRFTNILSFCLGKHFSFYHEGYLKIGCEGHSVDYWVKNYKEVGAEYSYGDNIEVYGDMIRLLYNLKNK